jgi:predicted nucleic acid-binding protein
MDYFRTDGKFINSEYSNVKFIHEIDNKFYEVFKSGEAEYLITGNIKHFQKGNGIVSPKEFIERYCV